MDEGIPIFKYDVIELLTGSYNKYGNDGALITSVENISLSDSDKEYLKLSKKRKAILGHVKRIDGINTFIKCS